VLPGTQLHRDHEQYELRFDEERYYRVLQSNTLDNDDLRRAQDFVIERFLALPANDDRYRRVSWTNFDNQATMFADRTLTPV
jgi:hypothetical protein